MYHMQQGSTESASKPHVANVLVQVSLIEPTQLSPNIIISFVPIADCCIAQSLRESLAPFRVPQHLLNPSSSSLSTQ